MEREELFGKSLDGFRVERMWGVYPCNEDGRTLKGSPLGFFRDKAVAEGYKETLRSPNFHSVNEEAVITDGQEAFLLGKEVKLLSDEEGMLDIRKHALKKLSSAEARALGLKKPEEE